MLRAIDLTLARGTRRLLDGANLTVHAGHRIGLVGANGSGKSSLFAAIRGELHPDAGRIELPASWTLAHVAQETPPVDASALDFVLDGDEELRQIERDLAAAEADPPYDGVLSPEGPPRGTEAPPRGAATPNASEASVGVLSPEGPSRGTDAPPRGAASEARVGVLIAELHHRFEAIDGYSARARAAMLLSGLGFAEARHGDPVASFSGGWRMRLNLAQALQSRSDLLLLDEPTNHLDLDAVLWLEEWLRRYQGTLLLITHDRDFLDGVVDGIVHVDDRKLVAYTGNYAQFETERAQKLALQQATWAKQQRQVAHLQSFIDRFRAKASKAKQAQSRVKALERLEVIATAHVDSPFEFAFAPVGRTARQLVLLEDATLGYPERPPVLSRLDFNLLAGDRIGLLGPNGAGKSTLLKAIAGTIAPLAGDRRVAQGLRLGYFAQHQVEQLRLEHSPLWHLSRMEPDVREQEHRDFLGGFDFRGDMASAAVANFSGGEKARLTLALIVRQKPNLLLLDEPTNHLDIEMREALTEALQDYEGTLVVVAHDRHLLRATTDALWLVADGEVAPFDGDLEDYRDWVLSQKKRERVAAQAQTRAVPPPTGDDAALDRKARKREEAQARQRLAAARKPLLSRQAKLEGDIDALGKERADLDAWLATTEAYAAEAKEVLKERIARQGELTWQLARLESEWLENAEKLEQVAADLADGVD